MKQDLYEKLLAYGDSDHYPFHMPGHKRNEAAFIKEETSPARPDPLAAVSRIDITEITGFDNLHYPEGILKDAQEAAAEAYGAVKSWYLVGGSTTGILAALSAAVPKGGRILIARNSHKSVYHGIYLRGLAVSYLYPEYDPVFGVPLPVTEEAVRRALEEEGDIRAVLITSPTYEGLTADVERIASAVHEWGIPLIVDEAHGAHFGFSDMLPASSTAWADVVVHSTHKTTRAMTQTALLHLCSGRVAAEEIQKYLDIYMTSSPSYVLMASIEQAIRELKERGNELFTAFWKRRELLLKDMDSLSCVKALQTDRDRQDPCKLLFGDISGRLSGLALKEILREAYHLEMEMSQGNHVLAILTPYDSAEGIERLQRALQEIDDGLKKKKAAALCSQPLYAAIKPERRKMLESAWQQGERIPLSEAGGRISSEFVYQYPPGTPLIVPGEVWDQELIRYIKRLSESGYEVLGTEIIREVIYIKVLREGEIIC